MKLESVTISNCKELGREMYRQGVKATVRDDRYKAVLEQIEAYVDTIIEPVFSNIDKQFKEVKKYTRAIQSGRIDEALKDLDI